MRLQWLYLVCPCCVGKRFALVGRKMQMLANVSPLMTKIHEKYPYLTGEEARRENFKLAASTMGQSSQGFRRELPFLAFDADPWMKEKSFLKKRAKSFHPKPVLEVSIFRHGLTTRHVSIWPQPGCMSLAQIFNRSNLAQVRKRRLGCNGPCPQGQRSTGQPRRFRPCGRFSVSTKRVTDITCIGSDLRGWHDSQRP